MRTRQTTYPFSHAKLLVFIIGFWILLNPVSCRSAKSVNCPSIGQSNLQPIENTEIEIGCMNHFLIPEEVVIHSNHLGVSSPPLAAGRFIQQFDN